MTAHSFRMLKRRMHNNNVWQKNIRIPSNTDAGRALVEEVLAEARKREWPEDDLFGVHLALEEALVNAIRHGNQMDERKLVSIDCTVSAEQVAVQIADEGNGFDPNELPDPTLDENLECPSGRGVMLMRSFMDQVDFNHTGNAVSMRKNRSAS